MDAPAPIYRVAELISYADGIQVTAAAAMGIHSKPPTTAAPARLPVQRNFPLKAQPAQRVGVEP